MSIVSWSTSALDVLNTYLEVHPDTGARDRLVLTLGFDALLRAGWNSKDVAGAASAYAALGGIASGFVPWAWRRRRRR